MTSTDANESPKIEIEIATVLLGFLFVIYSIVLTMPTDVLTKVGDIDYSTPFYSGNAANFFSLYGYYGAIALLTAIPFYLLYQKIGRELTLTLARSFLALGVFMIVNLVVVLNAILMYRLVGAQGFASTNPLSVWVMLGSLVAFPYILWLWLRLSPKLQSFWKKHKEIFLSWLNST